MANSPEQTPPLSPEQRRLLLLRLKEKKDGARAAQSSATEAKRSLVEVQPAGMKRPFFCVHAFGGGVNSYHLLSSFTGLEQPFYGLQARGLNGQDEPLTGVEEMAALYIEAVRTVQPEGPYLLGGWCFGGLVALEMAQQLRARNESVALLALIGTVEPSCQILSERDDTTLLVEMLRDNWNLPFIGSRLEHADLKDLRKLSSDERLGYALEQLKQYQLVPSGYGLQWFRGHFKVYQANDKAMRNYKPRAYAGELTLFRPADEPDDSVPHADLGWGRLAARVETIEIPCTHVDLLREPHVRTLAQLLSRRLDAAADSAESTRHSADG